MIKIQIVGRYGKDEEAHRREIYRVPSKEELDALAVESQRMVDAMNADKAERARASAAKRADEKQRKAAERQRKADEKAERGC